MRRGYKDLEEYGIVGNLETCALVGKDGSVDWLCLPFLDSPSVFAAILDADRGGSFSITPYTKQDSIQEYVRATNVLQTTFGTSFGTAVVTDFMPARRNGRSSTPIALMRRVECVKGSIRLTIRLEPRFDYARAGAGTFEPVKGGVVCSCKEHELFLQSPVELQLAAEAATGVLEAKEDDVFWFVLRYGGRETIGDSECQAMLRKEIRFWRNWAHICRDENCVLAGIWHDVAVRSGLVLKLLANPDSGAIAAAPTASLPEEVGGVRNWDYRYAWLRDSSMTDQALYHLGHVNEAKAYRKWMERIIRESGDPASIKIMYPLHENTDLGEFVLSNLRGYRDSAPVRVGNLASGQFQLDIYGELVNAVYETTRRGEELDPDSWPPLREIVEHVCRVWDSRDSGIWESRSDPRHYVYSKLMCWVAVDRGMAIARAQRLEAPKEKWERVAGGIRQAILDRGFSRRLNSFVQSFDDEALDATALLIPQMGLLPYDDPRVQGTVDAVMRKLTDEHGLICRYLNDDGIAGDEGRFLLCSFWLIRTLALGGRLDEAVDYFMRILKFVSPLGLVSEEVDPASGRLVGNFPQAFSHIGLVNCALAIGRAQGRKSDPRGRRLGTGRRRK